MKLLLHICCGPCALPIIESLNKKGKNNLSLFFYNPNIYPKKEYLKRLKTARQTAKHYGLVLIEGKYETKKWLSYLENNLHETLQDYKENGQRCDFCFLFRLQETASFAKKKGFDAFATTLSVNRFKDTEHINCRAEKLAKENSLFYITFSLDPWEAHKKEKELSNNLKLYQQKYCGCIYSLPG